MFVLNRPDLSQPLVDPSRPKPALRAVSRHYLITLS